MHRQIGGESNEREITVTIRKDTMAAAVGAALLAGMIGSGVALAHATPIPGPQAPVVDAPEPGDTPDVPGAPDNDGIQGADQSGPEVPDTPATPLPPRR